MSAMLSHHNSYATHYPVIMIDNNVPILPQGNMHPAYLSVGYLVVVV